MNVKSVEIENKIIELNIKEVEINKLSEKCNNFVKNKEDYIEDIIFKKEKENKIKETQLKQKEN